MKLLTVIIILTTLLPCQAQTVKFAVTADVHHDIMHDASDRLNAFLDGAKKNNVDFVIELGDFCWAKDLNIPFKKIWHDYEGEKHNVIGNHDMDGNSKDDYIKFMDMPSRYYSFDKGDFLFIVLDPNIVVSGGKYIEPYGTGTYGQYLDPDQIEWLKKELASTKKRVVIFSHQGFEKSVTNGDEVRKIFEDENKKAGYLKILAAFSGHDHTSYMKEINGISYIQINSASNIWVGDEYISDGRYTKEINEKYPWLKYTVPYKEALYSIVTIGKNKIKVKGVKSEFASPTPDDLSVPNPFYGNPVVSWNEDFTIDIKK